MGWNNLKVRRPLVFLFLLCFMGALLFGCNRPGIRQGPYSVGDEALQPYAAMYEIDRSAHCLSEIARDAEVYVSTADSPSSGYDMMLQVSTDSVSRSVFFVWEDQQYVWIGEQEIHYSGREYTSLDGTLPEQIIISSFERPIRGGLVGLRISYYGDEDRSWDMTCKEARSYITRWHAN